MSDASPSSTAALFLLGVSHHTAPLALREKLALPPEKFTALHAEKLAALPGLREIAVLNTCNRVEFYGVANTPEVVARLQAEFCAYQNFPSDAFSLLRRHALGPDALRHLLEVSAGLQSQMLGETEILGQLKDAYADAQARRTVGPVLNRVFQKTFQHAKYIRTHTALTAGQISVANVAVDLAQKIFGELTSTRILLLGAGEIGEKTARAFQSRGSAALTVASRTMERAIELARVFDGAALPFETAPHHFADFDIIVCTTAAPHAIVTSADIVAAMKKRRVLPLFLIDLALPRDVEPGVAELENVFLYNLDDLAKIADENRAVREAEVTRAKAIVAEKAAALWRQIEAQVPRR
jgi:glutamyl-tRNA reductase